MEMIKEEESPAPNGTGANNEISLLQTLAQNTQGEVVYAVDEYGNQIALGVIISEDFNNYTQTSESNEEITVSEDNQLNWIAAEEECPSNCNTMESTDIKQEPFVPLSTTVTDVNPLNIQKKCEKDVIKIYKIDNAARKTLKKIKASKKSRKTVIPSNVKPCEKYKVASVQGLHKKKKTTKRKQSDKTFAMPNSLRGIKFNERPRSNRQKRLPQKYKIYWDMNIPTQYYKEEFIHFEQEFQVKWDKFVGNKKQDYSEFILQEFVRYEQKIKKECQKQTYGRERFISDEEKSKLLTEDTQNIPRAMDDSSLQMSCIPNEAMHDIHKETIASPNSTDLNQLQAVKFAIVRSMASLSSGNRGKYINIRNISLDLPLSPILFKNYFYVNYCGEQSCKQSFPVEHFDSIFGSRWHIYNFPNSSTRKRIIGLVLSHFRNKKIDVFIDDSEESSHGRQISSFWLRIKFQAVKENVQIQEQLADFEFNT